VCCAHGSVQALPNAFGHLFIFPITQLSIKTYCIDKLNKCNTEPGIIHPSYMYYIVQRNSINLLEIKSDDRQTDSALIHPILRRTGIKSSDTKQHYRTQHLQHRQTNLSNTSDRDSNSELSVDMVTLDL